MHSVSAGPYNCGNTINVTTTVNNTGNDNFTGTILNEDNGVSPIEVSKESYEYRRLRITYNLCSSQTDHCDKPELVPIGKHSITFNCECHACKKQRNFNQTIDFCIYNNNKTQECFN